MPEAEPSVEALCNWRQNSNAPTILVLVVIEELPSETTGRVMMSEMARSEPAHRRPDAQAMGATHVAFDLGAELELLQQEREWQTGHNSKTLVKYDSLRIVLIAMKARTRIPEHQTEGRISIQTLRGHVLVHASGQRFDLPIGGLLALDQGLRHDVEALEDSAFLLSIAWPGRNAK